MSEISGKFLEGIPTAAAKPLDELLEERARGLRALGPEPGLPAPENRGAIFHVGQEVVLYDSGLWDRGIRSGVEGRFRITKIEPGRIRLEGTPKK